MDQSDDDEFEFDLYNDDGDNDELDNAKSSNV
jgi:hypothetical protein